MGTVTVTFLSPRLSVRMMDAEVPQTAAPWRGHRVCVIDLCVPSIPAQCLAWAAFVQWGVNWYERVGKTVLCYRAPELGRSSLLGGTFLLLSTGQDLGPTCKTRYLTRMQAGVVGQLPTGSVWHTVCPFQGDLFTPQFRSQNIAKLEIRLWFGCPGPWMWTDHF